jgi:hypothetical protein
MEGWSRREILTGGVVALVLDGVRAGRAGAQPLPEIVVYKGPT